MIERAGIKFTDLPDEDFDPPLGETTGAATIFGATGGVMEAALRTAVELVTGESWRKWSFTTCAAPTASRRPATMWAA